MKSREFKKPPIETETPEERETRLKMLKCGASVAEFSLAHLQRDDDTGEILVVPKHEITDEIARIYGPAFEEAVAHPEYDLDKDSTCLDPDQIIAVSSLLSGREALQ